MEFSLQIERPSTTLHKLIIKVPSQEVKTHFDQKAAAIQRTAKLKGFRPGQVPISLVKQYYGDDIRREVFKILVDHSFEAAVSREKLRTVGDPEIETSHAACASGSHEGHDHDHDHDHHHHFVFREDEDLTYTATVEILPEIEIENYFGLSLMYKKVDVREEQVQGVIEHLRQMQARLSPLSEPRPVQSGDFVDVQITGKVITSEALSEKESSEFRPDLSGTKLVEVGANTWIPGFEDQLIGMSLSETKTFRIFFPKDFHDLILAEKEAEFTVLLNEIKEKKLPPLPLDDEFAKRLGYEDILDMHTKVKEYLEAETALDANKNLESELISKLMKMVHFEIPSGLVKRQTQSLVQDWVRDLQDKHVSPKNIEKMVIEELPRLEERAEDQLRASLILESIAIKEAISVSQRDMDAAVSRIVAEAGPKDRNDLKEFYEKSSNRTNLRFRLRQQKTVDLLLSRAEIAGNATPAVADAVADIDSNC